ncbi:hypothetical protein OE88DRAFT_1341423 [Heliocybe sulcata]|uniref:Uncharacterized protein n=1 Tax=Heliocybe sulcata TaxID=5364 RepID=A0A5C3NAU7_9AGAM|nr:hypothetical protein OE88DRAFT_1341423 [Heliocybe sulcata]
MSAIRPILPQDPALESVALIEVRHPCQDVELFSFWLRRCPLADGSMSANACIPLTVILDACAILTGDYTYTAAICNDRDGEGPVLPGLVNAGTYYLIPDVANPRADYAVYKTFDHWIPPLRSQLPDRWFTAKCPKDTTLYIGDAELGSEYKVARSQISAAVKAVDKVCMMTLAAIPLASAHIVPVSCALWFQKRRIPRQLYIPHVLPHHLTPEFYVHDYRNHITLREDIRSLWDAYEWICVPVGDTFIAYVITDIRASLGFHCYSPRLPDRTDGYLLFLRFALAVFHQFAGSDDLATHKDHDPIAIKPSGANRRGRASGVSVKPTLPDTTEAQDDVNTAVDEDGGSGVSHSIGSSVDGLPECDIDDRGVARLIIEGFERRTRTPRRYGGLLHRQVPGLVREPRRDEVALV